MSKALFVISSSGFSNFSCPRKAKVWRYSYLQTAAFMSSGISSVLLLIVLSDCLQSSSDTHHTIQPSSCCLWFGSRASRQSFSKGIFPFQIPLSLLTWHHACFGWLLPRNDVLGQKVAEFCGPAEAMRRGAVAGVFSKQRFLGFFLLYTTIKLENK